MRGRKRKEETGTACAGRVAQATLRPRSDLECERLIRLSYEKGIASATAYRSPADNDSPIFLMLLDREEDVDRFLPELLEAAPEIPVSVVREEVLHAAPSDFLGGGAFAPRPFGVEVRNAVLVFAGGALGAGARLLLESGASYLLPFHAVFPWGTMSVNVLGSFAISVFGALLFERFVGERERMFWVLGFLGSFTTFSSYAFQTTRSWEASPPLGALYGGSSVALGLLAAFLGLRLTRRMLR